MIKKLFILITTLALFGFNNNPEPIKETKTLKVITYNIWNGFDWGKDVDRKEKLVTWVKAQNPDVMALQELCGYTQEQLLIDAKKWGHNYAQILKTTGYSVGITSKEPIEVKEKIITNPENYVWQPQRGGGGKYITSVENHLAFSNGLRKNNPSYTSIVRALKWWKNHKELKPYDDEPGISSFSIELIVAYLDATRGVEADIEEGIIRFFQFLSESNFPDICFDHAINSIPYYSSPIYIADDTNNENNAAKKIDRSKWDEIIEEAEDAFDSLNLAQSRNNESATVEEWKRVFGPTFILN